MFVFAAVAPRVVMRAAATVTRPMGAGVDLLSTVALLAIGLWLIGAAIRAVIRSSS
jgi:hypothetical protein